MVVFEKIITVSKDDIDQLNHVNNVKYVKWVNEIAESHWIQNSNKILRDKFFWILISHKIDYKSECLLGDQIKIKTYVKSSEGLKSIRIVEFHNLNSDKLAAISETTWCLMDYNSKKPTRITDEIKDLFE